MDFPLRNERIQRRIESAASGLSIPAVAASMHWRSASNPVAATAASKSLLSAKQR
jgi:hypothetical protein